MAWVKIPKEHHPLFLAAVPSDPDVSTMNMFGGIAATVNGNMAGGLFGRSMIVKLSPAHLQEALALEGASRFDPMGNGRIMSNTALLPEDVMEHFAEMRRWLQRAVDHARTLPPKAKKRPKAEKRPSVGQASAPAKKKPVAKKKTVAKKKAVRARTR